ERGAVTAGRAVLRRLDELAAGRRSFGFETTLASRSFSPRIRALIRLDISATWSFSGCQARTLQWRGWRIGFVSEVTQYRRKRFVVGTTRVCVTSSLSIKL